MSLVTLHISVSAVNVKQWSESATLAGDYSFLLSEFAVANQIVSANYTD